MEKVSLSISNMSCGHCVKSVKRTLEAVPGVSEAEVFIGTAIVEFDPDEVSQDEIVEAVNQTDIYTAEVE